jgi:hypothetical protein
MKTERKTIPIYSLRLARKLMNKGYFLNHTDRNRVYPDLKVFYFRYAPGIYDEIELYKEAVSG